MSAKENQSEFYKKLGVSIKRARQRAFLKQEYVAYQLGLTRTSLVNIEQGNQKIQVHALVQLAEILNISLNELIPSTLDVSKVSLDKKSETKLTKELDKQVNNTKETFEILSNFLKLSQNKNSNK
ncbi:helix-turn-helix domain-containing protein [Pedobacter sp.]|uniref:helix-turn-helix domain-containing protein n=1 Tax=Pedobacter sp. TaxID=1411316 RepID=UPI003BA9E523